MLGTLETTLGPKTLPFATRHDYYVTIFHFVFLLHVAWRNEGEFKNSRGTKAMLIPLAIVHPIK